MNYDCPKCQRAIYNRRNKFCGFCGVELPKELLFTAEEIAAIILEEETVKEQLRKEREVREAKEQERDKKSLIKKNFPSLAG